MTLTADLRNGTGTVSLAGTVERTEFRIQGIERRWDWCLADDGTFECAFIVTPDGRARYVSFAGSAPDSDGTKRAKPTSLAFDCPFASTKCRVGTISTS